MQIKRRVLLDLTSNETGPCPKKVAASLLNIAKNYDALDSIGNSTSWRWQEGFISRMPKASTVAAVLTKAFKSDDPKVWLKSVGADLQPFIRNTFGIGFKENIINGDIISDVYDSVFLVSITSSSDGTCHEELIFQFCFYKYALSLDDDDSAYELPNPQFVLELYSVWAEKKLRKVLEKFSFVYGQERYSFGASSIYITGEKHNQNMLKVAKLKNRVVGGTSSFDMWRSFWFRLTDEQHIVIEKKILNFVSDLDKYIEQTYNDQDSENAKPRFYTFLANSMPSKNEVLR